MRTTWSFLLDLLLLAAPLAAHGQLSWVTNADNVTATITGYSGSGAAVIPSAVSGLTVTGIGTGIPLSVGSVTSFSIPSSVTNIGLAAFQHFSVLTAITVDPQNSLFSSLNGVLFDINQTTLIAYPIALRQNYTIPGGVTIIGAYAFYDAFELTGITIPNSVTTIGDYAFAECSALTSVTIPDSVTSIGSYAFAWAWLTSIAIPGSVTNMGTDAFSVCRATNATFASGVSSIGVAAFNDCDSLLSVTIADTVTNIGSLAFANCISLLHVTIPSSVRNLADYSFYGCASLTNVVIGNGVTAIGFMSFAFCSGLRSLYFGGNVPTADGSACMSDTNATVYYLPGTSGWSSTFAGRPTALWFLPNPIMLNNGPGFGVESNSFGFMISWATNSPVVVEVSTNLANPVWTPLQTNTLVNGSFHFSELVQTNSTGRFYGLGLP